MSSSGPKPSTLRVLCQCTQISFPAPLPRPVALYHCHCNECRRQSASAFGTSAAFPADLVFPLIPPEMLDPSKMGIYTRPTASGGKTDGYFCRNCGSRILHRGWKADGSPKEMINIKAGCLVVDGDDEQVKPGERGGDGAKGLEKMDWWKEGVHIFVEEAVVRIPEGSKMYVGHSSSPPIVAPPIVDDEEGGGGK